MMVLLLFPSPLFHASACGADRYGDTQGAHLEVVLVTAQYTPHSQIVVESNEDLARLGFPGDGSLNSPYIIEDLNITDAGTCISMTDVTAHVIIRDCLFVSSSVWTLDLDSVSNCSIRRCRIQGRQVGIHCSNVTEVQIRDNTIFDLTGIDVGGNTYDGVGVYMTDSHSSIISDNTIYANNVGLTFHNTNNCLCSGNTIYGNNGIGAEILADSIDNRFVANVFGWNEHSQYSGDNAHDQGVNNTWSENYWSDYSPPGAYYVPGSAISRDLNPRLLVDNSFPILTSSEEVIMAEGARVQIVWTTSDLFPLTYEILVNGETQTIRTWGQSNITFDLSHLPVGTHDVTLMVTDAARNVAAHYVEVNVLFVFLSDMGTELVVVASGVSVVSVVAVLLLIKRKL
ncbi:MAG: NosD domain-containing protein [Promethearchaeota archaeon]